MMTPEERSAAALATYKAIQKRKRYREKRKQYDADDFTLRAVERCVLLRRDRKR